MKLVYIDEDSLLALRSNLQVLVPHFTESTSDWIEDYFDKSPFLQTKYSTEDFDLDMSAEKPFFTEFENVKRVYNHLNFLNESEASDERLWAGLCLKTFWKYVQYRWNIINQCTHNNVLQHYFFGFGARRSLTRNALSRLWWIGHLTYDKSNKNPYIYTEFVCENADYILHILERNTSNNPYIVRTFVSTIIDARNDGALIDTNTVATLSQYLNLLGGTYILDCLPEEFLRKKIMDHLERIS